MWATVAALTLTVRADLPSQLPGAAGAAAAAASFLPPSLHTAMALPPRRGGLDAVEHVIVLMQENRSFSHYFGTLRGVRGFGDRTPLRLPDGRTVFEQPAPGRAPVLPFSLRQAAEQAGRPVSDIQYLDALNHDFVGTTSAWAQGWNNNWVAAKTASTMTYYERADLPLQYELADTFTMCDAYHCSVFGSTNPNRNYLWSGTTGFEPGSTDARAVTNAAYDYDHAGYDWTTYPERLQAAGVPWQIYQEWDNFTDNAVEYFLPFKKIGRAMLGGAFRTTEELYDTVVKSPPAEQKRLLDLLAAGRSRLSPADRSLFDRAMARSAPETLVTRLRADIAAGTLPRASWLVPSAIDSEHPSTSTPVGSANLVYDVLDAIASDPDTWSTTVLLVNFDENDGYFDHVPPPVPPRPASGAGDDYYNGLPIGLGPRVPMTVVSPWTIGGHVDSQVFDHTSVLRLLERWTGVKEPNISTWRRAVCGDLTSAFDFTRGGSPPRPRKPGPVPAPIERWHPDAPADGALPAQEPGTRPARALPYALTVGIAADAAGNVAFRFGNRAPASAHVAIYPYAGELPAPLHLDVLGDHVETVRPPGAAHRLAVQGPNRFWAETAGSRTGAAARLGLDMTTIGPVPRFGLTNGGPGTLTVTLRALAYGTRTERVTLRPGQRRAVLWPGRTGWFDVEVTVAQDTSFRRRVTGRVENGRPGVSG